MSLSSSKNPQRSLLACWLLAACIISILPEIICSHVPGHEVIVNKGIDSCIVLVGFLFHHRIPDDAFSGDVIKYKVSITENCDGPLPEWLEFDQSTKTFNGFTQAGQVDTKTVVCVEAIGRSTPDQPPSVAKVLFTVTVDVGLTPAFTCKRSDTVVLGTVYVDVTLPSLDKPEILKVLDSVGGVLSIPPEDVRFTRLVRRYNPRRNPVLFSGKGDSKGQQENQGARVQFQVGCSSDTITEQNRYVQFLQQKAPTGELSRIIGYPVMDWTVHKGFPRGNGRKH